MEKKEEIFFVYISNGSNLWNQQSFYFYPEVHTGLTMWPALHCAKQNLIKFINEWIEAFLNHQYLQTFTSENKQIFVWYKEILSRSRMTGSGPPLTNQTQSHRKKLYLHPFGWLNIQLHMQTMLISLISQSKECFLSVNKSDTNHLITHIYPRANIVPDIKCSAANSSNKINHWPADSLPRRFFIKIMKIMKTYSTSYRYF